MQITLRNKKEINVLVFFYLNELFLLDLIYKSNNKVSSYLDLLLFWTYEESFLFYV